MKDATKMEGPIAAKYGEELKIGNLNSEIIFPDIRFIHSVVKTTEIETNKLMVWHNFSVFISKDDDLKGFVISSQIYYTGDVMLHCMGHIFSIKNVSTEGLDDDEIVIKVEKI